MMGYKRGDVIMENRPWAYVVNDDTREKCCHYCLTSENLDDLMGKTRKLQRCSNCRYAYFCNAACLKSAWKDHKFECQRIKHLQETNSPLPTAHIRLATRVFQKYFRGDIADAPGACKPVTNRTFLNLWHHADKVRESISHLSSYRKVIKEVREFMGTENMPSGDDATLLPVYYRILINSMNMDDGELEVRKGTGLYLGASMFDHSCLPNADFLIRDHSPSIYIVALEDIDDITSVRIRYGEIFEPTRNRKDHLSKTYFFDCDCVLCRDIKRDDMYRWVCCPNCNGPVPLTATFKPAGNCRHCQVGTAPSAVIKQAKDLTDDVIQMLTRSEKVLTSRLLDEEVKSANFANLKTVYNNSIRNVLHRCNWVYVKFVQHVMDYYILLDGNEDVDFRSQLFVECVNAYRRYDVTSPTFGLRLAILAEFLALHNRFEEASRYFDEAEPILVMFFGKKHSLYKRMTMSRNIMEQYKVIQSMARV